MRFESVRAIEFGIEDEVLGYRRDLWKSPELAKALRAGPVISLWREETQRRQQESRLLNPKLDYALNVFGFTGSQLSFQNVTARLWWEQDGQAPNLARF